MNLNLSFRPKLAETLRNYSSKDFSKDLIAGLTVGIVALPLAMAFAIAALGASGPTVIHDAGAAAVSYPEFFSVLESLRA